MLLDFWTILYLYPVPSSIKSSTPTYYNLVYICCRLHLQLSQSQTCASLVLSNQFDPRQNQPSTWATQHISLFIQVILQAFPHPQTPSPSSPCPTTHSSSSHQSTTQSQTHISFPTSHILKSNLPPLCNQQPRNFTLLYCKYYSIHYLPLIYHQLQPSSSPTSQILRKTKRITKTPWREYCWKEHIDL